jgi:hypothetical protein
MPQPPPSIRHFFVDEAGDLTLFDRRGRVLVGEPGNSYTFMVGLCELPDPMVAHEALEALRAELISDPYFRGVPSMQRATRKTALAFHAKDDLPEVRREVFRLLPSFNPSIVVALRRKHELAEFARRRQQVSGRKVTPDLIYDELVERVCKDRLHKAEEHRIVFARRGKADRNASDHAGLQVADYLMWGLQRMIERREDRYFNALAPHYRLVMDLDDRRNKAYGEWYNDSNPLQLEKLKPVAPG